MQIHFDTDRDSKEDASALVTLLNLRYLLTPVAPTITTVEAISKRVERTHAENVEIVKAAVVEKIAVDDAPDTGLAAAAEVFAAPVMLEGANGTTYEQYIAAGWSDEQLIAHSKMAAPVQNAAAVFGGAPGAPLTLTNGAPPAPSNTAVTSQQPPQDAASVFGAKNATPAQSAGSANNVVVSIGNALLDSDGLPWDGRIHASTRSTTAKGAWKKRKGVDEAEAARVTVELRTAIAANKAAEHKPLNGGALPPPPPPPPPAASNGGALPPPPPPGAANIDFAAVATYVGEQAFDQATIQRVMQHHGLPGLSLLVNAPNLCAPVMTSFQQLVAARQA